ncbi:MAG: cyclic-di-AMP receptor [Oscillospiraceae bacterium]|jgi:uncharacterized protein YaaQ|nr:cyclic-di-AMP receptor [Oscillospiraceae bacterium]
MKLVLAIVGNDDVPVAISELMRAGFFVTKLSSSGGFLHAGNTTLMIGVEDARVDAVRELIGQYCKKRRQLAPPSPAHFAEGLATSLPIEITVGGATVFVLDVDDFEKV